MGGARRRTDRVSACPQQQCQYKYIKLSLPSRDRALSPPVDCEKCLKSPKSAFSTRGQAGPGHLKTRPYHSRALQLGNVRMRADVQETESVRFITESCTFNSTRQISSQLYLALLCYVSASSGYSTSILAVGFALQVNLHLPLNSVH